MICLAYPVAITEASRVDLVNTGRLPPFRIVRLGHNVTGHLTSRDRHDTKDRLELFDIRKGKSKLSGAKIDLLSAVRYESSRS